MGCSSCACSVFDNCTRFALNAPGCKSCRAMAADVCNLVSQNGLLPYMVSLIAYHLGTALPSPCHTVRRQDQVHQPLPHQRLMVPGRLAGIRVSAACMPCISGIVYIRLACVSACVCGGDACACKPSRMLAPGTTSATHGHKAPIPSGLIVHS